MTFVKRAMWAIAFALVAAALLGNATLSYRNTQALAEGTAASSRSREVIAAAEDLMATITDAETGQRGFLLTDKQDYLAPYDAALVALPSKLQLLRNLLSDNPAQISRLDKMQAAIDRKVDELTRTVALENAGKHAAALAVVEADSGRQMMLEIRHAFDGIYASEQVLQASRDAHASELYTSSQYSRIAGMLVGLALVALAIFLLRRDIAGRLEAARQMFIQREWFRTTLHSIGDAVIVTDSRGHVVLLNPIAEEMTGWATAAAAGKPLLEVFDIINEVTRETAVDPVRRALDEGRIVGLANHTVLRSRNGREYVIEDSAAPSYDAEGKIQGAVMVFHDSTSRRESEIALSNASAEIARRASVAVAAESTLNTILDNAPIGILMTGPAPDFPIVAISHTMREWLDASENTPANRAYRKVLPDGSTPHPHLLPLHRAMNEGISIRDEQWIIERPNKKPLTVVVNVAPVRDSDGAIVGAVHSWVDLTERQQLDHALRVIESRLRVLVDANVIGLILSFDGDGKVTQANGAFLDMLGFSTAELANGIINLRTQTPAEHRNSDEISYLDMAARGYCTPYEKEFLRHGSANERVSVVVGYAKVVGVENEFVGFVLDVSARKQLERQLREQTDQLLLADRKKDEFLAMLAHELRNPLAPLRNAVHLLDTQRADHELVASLVPTMHRQIEHLIRLVDDLLDAARITQGKITLERSTVELANALDAAIEIIKPLIQSRGHELHVVCDRQPLYVDGDSTRLAQMFANILHNAAKYTYQAGRIDISLQRDGEQAVVRIRDNGKGIDSALLPHIFENFVQDDQSLARSAGGLGVGLALVRRLADLHGGSVRASSAGVDRGSEFELRLPLVQAPVEALKGPATAVMPVSSARHRVLVVDDNADLAESTATLLEMWGHASHIVYNGQEVLDSMKTFQANVVLLDIGLPGMDGFEVARTIRSTPGLNHVHLIAMTGYGQDSDRQRAHDAGFSTHLVKPVQPETLRLLLERLDLETAIQ